MNTLAIQPTLTPCNGSLDLISDMSPCGEFIELTWGTTLFLRIPHNRQTAVFRIIAGLFCQFGFEQKAVSGFLGVSAKTLRRWRNCLVEGTWDSLSVLFEGVHSRKLPDYLAMYARKRYRDFVDAGKTSPVHGYNQIIAGEIKEIWDIDVGHETLRQIFRDVDDVGDIPTEDGSISNSEISADLSGALSPVDIEAERTDGSERVGDLPSVSEVAHHLVSGEAEPIVKLVADVMEVRAEKELETVAGSSILGKALEEPVLAAHAGLFILSPWFETAFGSCRPIIRQTAAQILLGEVNQEQGKNVCFTSLEYFVNDLTHTPFTQRKLLDYEVIMDTSSTVWRGNATLTGADRCRTNYFDPNVVIYTGKEQLLMTWSGLDKAPKKGTNLDFFHTASGKPCYIGHDDGYYDARQRFLMIVERMRGLIKADSEQLTFVQDRGFWGDEFMKAMLVLGLYFIQWEKNYDRNGWDEPFEREGKMSIVRRKNSSRDKRKVRFTFREQIWPSQPNGRRIIVKTYDRKKKFEEFSIVTNNPEMRAEEVIRLMFNRWVQEGDFSYENRHFGIQELTSRKTNTYAQLEDTLEDRQVDSRAYKTARNKKISIQSNLGKLLIKLNTMPNPSSSALNARVKRFEERRSSLTAELAAIDVHETPHTMIGKISNKVKKALKTKKEIEAQQKKINKYETIEKEIAQITSALEEHEAIMAAIPRTESRLKAMVEEEKVKLDMGRKTLVDAVRVTSRNVFCEAHSIFRAIYDNYREDHVTLRQLTQSSGVITQTADGTVNIYLTPQLDRQPAQWRRIRTFLDIVEHRIRQQSGSIVKFHINKTNAQIFDAAARMKNRLKS